MTREQAWATAKQQCLHVVVKAEVYEAVSETNLYMLYLSQGWEFDEEYYA